MKREILAGMLIWPAVACVVFAAAPPIGTSSAQDDVQIREYRAGWGVLVRAPNVGDYPLVSTFEINPSPTHDHHKVGPYAVDIDWGVGPNGEPAVTIEPTR